VIELKGVWKRFKQGWALRDVNVVFDSGVNVVVGPNGSGKTTLVRIISGVLPPSRGTVMVDGVKPSKARDLIGVVFHTPILYDELSVRENLILFARLRGVDFREWIDLFDVRRVLDLKAGSLSFGWRKRVDIVRALMGAPPNLILDEPTSGLDEDAREELRSLLNSWKGCVVVTSPIRLEWGKVYCLRDGALANAGGSRCF